MNCIFKIIVGGYTFKLMLEGNIENLAVGGKRTAAKFPPGTTLLITKDMGTITIDVPAGATIKGMLTYEPVKGTGIK